MRVLQSLGVAGSVGCVVLDEADKMLSLGFKAQLDQIWERLTGQNGGGSCDSLAVRPQVRLNKSVTRAIDQQAHVDGLANAVTFKHVCM